MARKPITVSQLNKYMNKMVHMDPLLSNVYVGGEISNLKYHGSGNIFFTLKDEQSRISCFVPVQNALALRFRLSEGMKVLIQGSVYVKESSGTYSLIAREITHEGLGTLTVAFEALKSELQDLGYFDENRKKQIPIFPEKVAIITSDTGDAIGDILRIIKNRNHYVDILVVPCLVQGPSAAADIAGCIQKVSKRPDVDVIITGRGGGSLEELWAFNERIVADAIYNSQIPVITGIGHQYDFTIADFVADVRGQTPTEAAALAVPDLAELAASIDHTRIEMNHSMDALMDRLKNRVERLNLDVLSKSLENEIQHFGFMANAIRKDMDGAILQIIDRMTGRMKMAGDTLENLNPVSLMNKGYALVTDKEGNLVTDIESVAIQDTIHIQMKDGKIESEVKNVWREKR